jgi:hypothetical protein
MVPPAVFGIVNSGLVGPKNSLHKPARKAKINRSKLQAGNIRRLAGSIQYVVFLLVINLPESDIQTA